MPELNYREAAMSIEQPSDDLSFSARTDYDGSPRAGRAKVIDDPHIHRAQLMHFVLYDVAPFIGVAAALALLRVEPLRASDVIVFAAMWFVTGVGISVGYHRLFTHRSFKATEGLRVALAVFGAMAGQGGVVSWVAMHRRHHECGDREGDMHSPNLSGRDLFGRIRGFIHAHLTWMIRHPYPNVVHYAPDLLRDRTLVQVSQRYQTWVVLGLILPALVGGLIDRSWMGVLTGFLWGGAVRLCVVGQLIWSLNSLCHLIGDRIYETPDESRNISWLAPLFFGEAWHHNHHAFPGSASFGLAWYRIDPGYWLIKALGFLGLASDIKVPSQLQLQKKLAHR